MSESEATATTTTTTNHEEHQYLNMIQDVINNGVFREDRTGTGTYSIFGGQMRYSLRNHQFPLLTTKKVFMRGIVEELRWFLRGCTNSNELTRKNVHIWDAHGSREYFDQQGWICREQGDLGPVYGFQWRHFGATYIEHNTNYEGQGVDQIQYCLDQIKNNPTSRRIILSAWNPSDVPDMALPPCHLLCQFYVDTIKKELSCQLYQRSADLGLGVPFNIASYALLTCLFARECGLTPGDFVHTVGDAHVYANHIQPLKKQMEREPFPFPTLSLAPTIQSLQDFIDGHALEGIHVENYQCHPTVKMELAV